MSAAVASKKALVVGSGAVGLRTALELIELGVEVVLRSPRHPLHPTTCSMGAGGLWMPVHCTDPRTDRWAVETLDELLPQGMDDSNDMVEMLYAVDLKRDHSGPDVSDFASATYDVVNKSPADNVTETDKLPGWTRDPRIRFQHLAIEMLMWQNIAAQHRLRLPPEHEIKDAGYLYAWLWHTPVVNAPKMLQHYLDQVCLHDANVDVETGKEYGSIDEMKDDALTLGCDALFNCTGLGAGRICTDEKNDDEDLVGGRGVVLQFDRETSVRRQQPANEEESPSGGDNGEDTMNDCVIMTAEAPWACDDAPCYLIPRGDVLVVGGTMLKGDTEPNLRESERKRLLLSASRLGIYLDRSPPPIGEWTGFRPYRSTVRCELDAKHSSTANGSIGGLKVIHNYGHGGSGWTINVGTAKEAVNLMFE